MNIIVSYFKSFIFLHNIQTENVIVSFLYVYRCQTTCLIYFHGITVTTTNADTSAKCNTVVHDNICGTKCYDYD